MALANSQGHISLNDESYLLIEESYEKRAQQPFSARFATGDPSTGDLSFWQFLTQKGWTGEGQEKYDVVSKYRQSAGWDMRDGKARLGFGIESIVVANALVDPYSLIAAYTLETFSSGSVDWAKWNYGGPFGNAGAIAAQAGAYGARTGYLATKSHAYVNPSAIGSQADGTFSDSWASGTVTQMAFGTVLSVSAQLTAIPARGTALSFINYPVHDGDQNVTDTVGGVIRTRDLYERIDQQIYQMGKTGMSLQSIGDWSCDLYVRNSVSQIHAAYGFMMNTTGGGYVLELSGAGVTTAKLYKTTAANCWDTTGNTLLKTWTLAGSSTNTKTTLTVRVTAGNVFSLYQDTVLVAGGTVTDTTYTTGDSLLFTTAYSASGDTTLSNFVIPSSAGSASGITGKFVHYNNKLYICYKATGVSDFVFTDTVAASIPSNQPGITHINVADACIWHRDADPTGFLNSVTAKSALLATVAGTTLNVYSGTTLVYTDGLAGVGAMVVPVNSTTLLVVGMTAENSGIPFIQRFVFTVNTNTLSTEKITHIDGGVFGTIVNSYAFDSNGMLYFATVDISGTDGAMPCRVFTINSTDLIATNPCITSVRTLSDFTVRAIESLAGSVYLFGAWREGGKAYSGIAKYPGTQIYRSSKGVQLAGGTNGALFNYGVATLWSSSRAIRFLSNNDLDLWDTVLEMDTSELIREVASFDSGQLDTENPNVIAICEWNGRYYCLNAAAGTIQRTTAVRGGLGSSNAYAILEMSKAGCNTELINKTLYSVTVELSAVVPSGETLSVLVNDTVVGTMVLADGTRKEIVLSSELTAAAFTVKLRWPQASTWTGYINNGPLLKYIPTQFKKRAWGFGIRATKRLKLGDGSHETRTPLEMFADIEDAWASNTPLDFTDVDGEEYSVIVTDFKQKRPLLQIDRSSEQEAFYFLELLEA